MFHDDIIGSESVFRDGRWNLIIRCKGGREETIDGLQFTTADLSAIHPRLLGLNLREQKVLQKQMDNRVRRNRTKKIVVYVIIFVAVYYLIRLSPNILPIYLR
jgi:hypothetical protein